MYVCVRPLPSVQVSFSSLSLGIGMRACEVRHCPLACEVSAMHGTSAGYAGDLGRLRCTGRVRDDRVIHGDLEESDARDE